MTNLHNTSLGKIISVLLCWAVLTGSLPIQQLRAAKVQQDSLSPSLPVTTNFEYDGSGNVVARVDGNGNRTEYEYDKINRLKSINYPGGGRPEVSFTYDGNGNLTSMTDWTGTTSYAYDDLDRLTAVDYPDGNVIMYGYDLVGNIAWVACGTRTKEGVVCGYTPIEEIGLCAYHLVHYEYDPDNRISSATDGLIGGTTSYAYDEAGNLARCDLPNGCYTHYGYDVDGRLIEVENRNAGNGLIAKYEYTLNSIGNRIKVVETTSTDTKTTTYTYDALDRLDTVSYPDERTVDYDYDSFGNRKTMKEMRGNTMTVTEYFYDSDSRLLYTKVNDIEDERFSYDAIGNLIRRTGPGGNKQIDYTYDHENRLIRYNDGTNNVTYAYDGLGYRVAKTVNGQRIGFLNDINRRYVEAIAEFDASGEPTRMRIWGNDLVSVRGHYVGTLHYYLHDAPAGSVCRVLNPTGQTVNSYEYDAFGSPTNETESIENSYQFHGEIQEEETSLVFLRARYYDSNMGRFLTRDPFSGFQERPSSLNLYVFTTNDPVNFSDPSGMSEDALYLYVRNPFKYKPPKQGPIAQLKRFVPHWGLGNKYREGWGYGPNGVFRETYEGYDMVWIPRGSYSRSEQAIQADKDQWSGSGYSLSPKNLAIYGLTGALSRICWTHSLTHIRLGDQSKSRAEESASPTPSRSEDNRGGAGGQPPGGGGGGTGGGDGPGGGGGLGGGGTVSQARLGGVDLNQTAEVFAEIDDIKGVAYDPATGQLVIYGREDAALPPMNLDDFVVAARAILRGFDPVVSFDPPEVSCIDDQGNERQCHTVRYGDYIWDESVGDFVLQDLSSGTHFGWVMYEADRLSKCLALGKDNVTLEDITCSVPGYKSLVQRRREAVVFTEGESSIRFWFQPETIKVVPSP
ncbi:MAG: RHS repeat-associated core domain-containing protein, partial [Sedimentisphaerales bacterium]